MYNSSSVQGNYNSIQSIDTLISQESSPSFSLADQVQQAYNCEGCAKALSRMYGWSEPEMIPHRDVQQYHAKTVGGKGYGSFILTSYGEGVSSYGDGSSSVLSKKECSSIESSENYQKISKTYDFTPSVFLKEERKATPFIENSNQIHELTKETFLQLTGKQIPNNLSISIVTKEELKEQHSRFGKWSDGIQGFALNGKEKKRIFIKQNHLDVLMMVIGHEVGHVFTKSLSNRHDEEAKAFSFEEAWVRCVKRHNIGNLASSIKDESDWVPAKNGLHDIAFFFVRSLLCKGLTPMDIHWDLAKGYKSLFTAYH